MWQCRRLLWLAGLRAKLTAAVEPVPAEKQGQRSCPVCGVGQMAVVEVLAAWPRSGVVAGEDSS